MKSHRALFLLSSLSMLSLNATNYSWNVNTSGNWDTDTNWTPNTGFPNAATDTATFPVITSPVTVTVDGIFSVDSLTFSNTTNGNNYTIASGGAGDSLTLGGTTSPGIFVNSGVLASQAISVPITLFSNIVISNSTTFPINLSGGISGSNNVIFSTGSVNLSGTNPYSGTTTINVGATVFADGTNALPSASSVTNNGTLNLNGNTPNAIGSLFGSGTVTNGSSITSILTVNSGGNFSGTIVDSTGKTGLTVASGTLILSGPNTYSGATTISSATLQAASTTALSSASAVTLQNGGVLNLNGFSNSIAALNGSSGTFVEIGSGGTTATLTISGGGSFAGVISGTNAALTLSGGSLTLSGVNTYTPGTSATATTINSGASLFLTGAGSLNASGNVSNIGTFNISGITSSTSVGSLTGSGALNLGGKLLNVNPNSTPTTYSGNITGVGGQLTLLGSVLWQLSGTNSYSGATTVGTGATLQAGSAGGLSSLSNFVVTGTLDLNGFNSTIASLSGAGSVTNNSTTTSVTLSITNGSNGGTFSGVISDGSSQTTAVDLLGGLLTLNNVNTYSGGTTITAGTLALSGTGQLLATAPVEVDGTFDISNISPATSTTIGDLTGTNNNGFIYLGNNTLLFGTADGTDTEFDGVIANGPAMTSGSLTYQGTGIFTLNGVATYTGTTTVSSGTFQAGALNVFASGSEFVVSMDGTLDLNGFSNTIESLSGSGTVTNNSSSTAAVLTITDGNGETFSGTIENGSRSLGITLAGGTLTLTGANTYTGTTTVSSAVSSAVLQAGANNTFSAASPVVLQNDGELELQTFNNTIYSLTGGTNTIVNVGTGATLTISNGGSFNGMIEGAGAVQLTGGSLTLTNANNDYSGGTTIGVGATLLLQGAGSLNETGDVIDNGTFNITGINTSITVGDMTGSGIINLGGKLLIVDPNDTPTTFSGNIIGSGGQLTLDSTTAGTPLWTLSGINTYTGATSVTTGATLQAGSTTAFSPNSAFALVGTLDLNGFNNTISSLTGTGVVTDSSTTADTLTLTNGSGAGSFSGVINDGLGMTGLTLNGGTFNLASASDANTYTGNTTLNNGAVLLAGNMNVLSSGSPMILNGSSTLNLQGFDNTVFSLTGSTNTTVTGTNSTLGVTNGGTFAGELINSLALNLSGGTLVLNSTNFNTYSGATTIGAATLQAGATSAFSPNSAVNITDPAGILALQTFANTIYSLQGQGSVTTTGTNAILTITNGNGLTYTGSITGAGGLTLSSGQLILSSSGLNTYSGPTTIASGATLQAGMATAFSPNSSTTVTGILNLNGFANTIGALNGSGSVTTNGGTLTVNNGGTFSGGITGAGGLNLTGGTLILSTTTSANTYSGTTTLTNAAVLQAGANNAFSSDSPMVLNSNSAVLNLNSFNNTIFSLSSTFAGSQVILGSGTLTIDGGATSTFAGQIINQPCGNLVIAGGTDQILTGVNTYCGTTLIQDGTIELGGDGSLSPSTAVTIAAMGTLINDSGFTNPNTTPITETLTNAGTITNSGTLYTNALTMTAGTFTNNTGAFFYGAGTSPTITISGGTVTNDNIFGSNSTIASPAVPTPISFTGGEIISSNLILASTYTQGSSATLTLDFSVAPYGEVLTDGNITLDGTLNVDAQAGYPTTGIWPLLVTSTGIVNGEFATVNLNGFSPPPSDRLVYALQSVSLFFGGDMAEWVATPDNAFWGDGTNWTTGTSPGLAGNNDDTATFGQPSTIETIILADATGDMPVNPMLFQLIFDTTDSYTINPFPTGGSSITFNATTAVNPQILVEAGNQYMNVPIILDLSTELVLDDGTSLTFQSGTSMTSLSTQTFFVRQSNAATIGNGTLYNEATLTPYSMDQASATIVNNDAITPFNMMTIGGIASGLTATFNNLANGAIVDPAGPLVIGGAGTTVVNNIGIAAIIESTGNNQYVQIGGAGLTTVTNSGTKAFIGSIGDPTNVTIGSSGTTIVYNSGIQASMGATGIGSGLIVGGSGTTLIYNDGAGAFLGATGAGGGVTIGSSGNTTVNNTGVSAEVGATGVGGSMVIGSSGITVINNDGEGALFGAFGADGDLTIQGAGTTVTNTGLNTKMGAFGLGGNVTITGGTVSNILGALFQAGSAGTLSITGGSLTNDDTSIVGTTSSDISLTGGILDTSGDVVAYDYTQGPGGTLVLNLTSLPSIYGNVAATGDASLNGTLAIQYFPGAAIAAGDVEYLVTAPRGVNGKFSHVDYLNFPAGLIPHVLYNPTNVELTFANAITPTSMASLAGMSFVSVNATNLLIQNEIFDLHRRIKKKKSQAQVEDEDDETAINNSVMRTDHLMASNDLAYAFRRQTKQSQLTRQVVEEEEEPFYPSRFYIGPTDSFGRFNTKGAIQKGFSFNSVGVFTGYDYAMDNFGIGLQGDFEHTSANVVRHAGNFNINRAHASAYATWVPDSHRAFAIDMIAGYGYDWFEIHRHAGITPTTVKTKANPHGQDVDALLGIEYIFSNPEYNGMPENLLVTPFLNAQYLWAGIDGFRERDGGIYGLQVHDQHAHSWRSCLGLRVDYIVETENVTFVPEFDFAWQLEYADHTRHLRISTLDSPVPFSTRGKIHGAGRNTLILGTDLLFTFYKVFELELNYYFQWNELYRDNSFYLGVGGNF